MDYTGEAEPWALSTYALHADSHLQDGPDIAPPVHVTTTFHFSEGMTPLWERPSLMDGDRSYARLNAPNTSRLEVILEPILKGKVVSYSSGCSAFFGLLVMLSPKRLFMSPGFSGFKNVAAIASRMTGMEVLPLDSDLSLIQPNDLIHVETPLNPTGLAVSIRKYANIAQSRGAFLSVDSSLGPPGLQEELEQCLLTQWHGYGGKDPFASGADIVLHSGTKYIGGHSDLLCGLLAVRRGDWAFQLAKDRIHLGTVMGNMESWLAVRSLRTLDLRVQRQSQTAEELVRWLSSCLDPTKSGPEVELVRRTVKAVLHSSLQHDDMDWLKLQMPNGFGPVFALELYNERVAKDLAGKLKFFKHTCSFGSVDSLIEWRRYTDQRVAPTVLKVSIGLENQEDLKADLLAAFRVLEA